MMANPWRGEVELEIDGEIVRARLTLGALAALEDALGVGSLVALAERFEGGGVSARDVLAVLGVAARAGGWTGSDEDLAHAEIGGGPLAGARIAAQLLARAFGVA